MKFSLRHIFVAHFSTLRHAGSDEISKVDVFWFYGVPVLFGICAAVTDVRAGRDFYNLSITFFGIFIALLLNIQVAIFSVFQRRWPDSADPMLSEIQRDKLLQRNTLLRELNITVSYLIAISCVYLSAAIVLYTLDVSNKAADIVCAYAYAHFILTLLMVVKRTFVLFQSEYNIG